MSLLFCDSFSWAAEDRALKYSSYSFYNCSVGAYGRNGEYGLRIPYGTADVGRDLGGLYNGVYVGIAYAPVSATVYQNYDLGFLRFANYSGRQVCLCMYYPYIRATRYGTYLEQSMKQMKTGGYWCYVEAYCYIDHTVGRVIVRQDGEITINYTGDTWYSGEQGIRKVELGCQNNADNRFCDFYICSEDGDTNNSFLGDVVVKPLAATSDGVYTDWTPQGAGSHYVEVDELGDIDTATYIETSTEGDKDSFGHDSLISSNKVKAIAIHTSAVQPEAGFGKVTPFIRDGGKDYYGNSFTVGATYLGAFNSWDKSPSTDSDWDYTSVNAIETGVLAGVTTTTTTV